MRARVLVAVAGAVGVTALAIGAAVGFGGGDAVPAAANPLKTAEIIRMTLVDYEDHPGEIGFGEVVPIRYVPPPPPEEPPPAGDGAQPTTAPKAEPTLGLVTWLAPVGSVVNRGDPLFRVDNKPVVLLIGPLPVYRTLKTGVTGPDVRQLEENLRQLGHSGFTVDDQFTASTASAVRAWQRTQGVAQTGAVGPGEVIYAAGAIRVAEHKVRVGDVATGDILAGSGAAPAVTATVPLGDRRGVTEGASVSIIMSAGATATGTIRRITTATPEGDRLGGGEPALRVEIEVTDPAALAGQEGPVTVRFVAEERPDVLAVPVVALVALAEGGYGVQVVEGSTTRYLAVKTGLFARGWVELTAGDVRPGMRVVVPA